MNLTKLSLVIIAQAFLLLIACSEKHDGATSMANGNQLKVSGDQIVNQKGDTIYLRGFG